MSFESEHDRIEKNLTLHPPQTPGVGARMDELRADAKRFSHLIDQLVPSSREKSMALTDVEDALMHAIAGVARNQEQLTDQGVDVG